MDTITKSEFKKLGQEWTMLDTEYDDLFQKFLDNPTTWIPAELERFKNMQKHLYAIEDELYKVAEGKVVIKE